MTATSPKLALVPALLATLAAALALSPARAAGDDLPAWLGAHVGIGEDQIAEPVLRRATRALERELDRQVLADGGHASRSPRLLTELLLDLLPLRQTYAGRRLDPPPALVGAIGRALPMLRLLRGGDGSLAHHNGMGASAADHVATLLVYDEARARAPHHAPDSGYERLEAGATLVHVHVRNPDETPS